MVLQRRRQGYVSLDTGNSDGTLGSGNPRRRSASSVPGFAGAAGPDPQQATAAAHAAATFRRVSDSGLEAPPSGGCRHAKLDRRACLAQCACRHRCDTLLMNAQRLLMSSTGLPPSAAPPNIRRPSSGAAGSDAIRRASFGRAAAVHNAAVSIQPQLQALAERSQDSAPGQP